MDIQDCLLVIGEITMKNRILESELETAKAANESLQQRVMEYEGQLERAEKENVGDIEKGKQRRQRKGRSVSSKRS